MRFVVVTDVHWNEHCAEKNYSLDQASLFMRAMSFANGDIDGVCADGFVDLENLSNYKRAFNALNPDISRYFLDGNHDGTWFVGRHASILEHHVGTSIVEAENARLIFWGASVRNDGHEQGYTASDEELEALKSALSSDKSVILGTHIPLYHDKEEDDPDHRDFSQKLRFPFYNNEAQIHEVIEEAGNVVLALSGHLHNYKTLDRGTAYVRLPSVTRPWSAGAFAVLDVDESKIDFRLYQNEAAIAYDEHPVQAFSISLF